MNNCWLRNTGSEMDLEHGACPMCNGKCPDRPRLEAEGIIIKATEG